jgi:hypothetical protein
MLRRSPKADYEPKPVPIGGRTSEVDRFLQVASQESCVLYTYSGISSIANLLFARNALLLRIARVRVPIARGWRTRELHPGKQVAKTALLHAPKVD